MYRHYLYELHYVWYYSYIYVLHSSVLYIVQFRRSIVLSENAQQIYILMIHVHQKLNDLGERAMFSVGLREESYRTTRGV